MIDQGLLVGMLSRDRLLKAVDTEAPETPIGSRSFPPSASRSRANRALGIAA